MARFLEHIVRTKKEPSPALESARAALELLYGTVLATVLDELPQPRPFMQPAFEAEKPKLPALWRDSVR